MADHKPQEFDMPFETGNPGGPGRPRGSRNRVNLLLDQLAEDNVQEILAKVLEAAREGDRKAQALVLRRMWSVPKGRPVELDLPAIEKPADLVVAHKALAAAMAAREVTAEEAARIALVLDGHRRAFELLDQQEIVEALQAEVLDFKRKIGRA
jgi:hypothetical protein